eukprot:CAMPEP_0180261096 /NCGR_PEP_ID=MMETSP0987-20121128/43957_1 /TAXON_ID=697907 /ORGANISM="non described non described, Strain CCMP2293" /LENGTH=110 /DNA_ID=CAMNT_0022231019 /DNA_START=267 /DNA_END=596 /DNA_ORIENTATION=+
MSQGNGDRKRAPSPTLGDGAAVKPSTRRTWRAQAKRQPAPHFRHASAGSAGAGNAGAVPPTPSADPSPSASCFRAALYRPPKEREPDRATPRLAAAASVPCAAAPADPAA